VSYFKFWTVQSDVLIEQFFVEQVAIILVTFFTVEFTAIAGSLYTKDPTCVQLIDELAQGAK
jgi:hypothetical protein